MIKTGYPIPYRLYAETFRGMTDLYPGINTETIKNKVQNMKAQFKKIKDNNNLPGASPRTMLYEKEMKELFGDRSSIEISGLPMSRPLSRRRCRNPLPVKPGSIQPTEEHIPSSNCRGLFDERVADSLAELAKEMKESNKISEEKATQTKRANDLRERELELEKAKFDFYKQIRYVIFR